MEHSIEPKAEPKVKPEPKPEPNPKPKPEYARISWSVDKILLAAEIAGVNLEEREAEELLKRTERVLKDAMVVTG